MSSLFGVRALLALAVVAAATLVALLFGGDMQASIIVAVGAVIAVLVAAGAADPTPASPPTPTTQTGPSPVDEVIEAVGEPVLVISDNRVIRANAAARALLGQHILGEDVRIAIRHPAAAERLLNPAGAPSAAPIHLVGLGARDQRWEMRVRDATDGQRIVHLLDKTGDYTAERMRVDFVANASHELKTPLASLLGYIETLGEDAGDDPPTRNRFLKIMLDEARRMQRLIEDLISLSRIEAEKYRAPGETVDLTALVDEVREEIAAGDGRRSAEVRLVAETIPPVRGDRAQLSQLLHNIIGNAIKYGRENTPVTIQLDTEKGGMVRLRVADEGEGIPPEHIPRLTERFYRVDSGRSRVMGGTGLGLAIVKHIVERHRGRLDIASVAGEGTTVTILLPAAR